MLASLQQSCCFQIVSLLAWHLACLSFMRLTVIALCGSLHVTLQLAASPRA